MFWLGEKKNKSDPFLLFITRTNQIFVFCFVFCCVNETTCHRCKNWSWWKSKSIDHRYFFVVVEQWHFGILVTNQQFDLIQFHDSWFHKIKWKETKWQLIKETKTKHTLFFVSNLSRLFIHHASDKRKIQQIKSKVIVFSMTCKLITSLMFFYCKFIGPKLGKCAAWWKKIVAGGSFNSI